MDLTWIEDVKSTIENNKKYIPNGYNKVEYSEITDGNHLISALITLFEEEEKAIEKEREKNYVTDYYELDVCNFASILIKKLVKYYEPLKKFDNYIQLLNKRHIAYSFYSELSNSLSDARKKYLEILKNKNAEKSLYLGLTKFYKKFFGRFHDNTNAIRLLCKFYSKNIDSDEENKEVVEAIYRHIQMAGTSSDIGFAFDGIDAIKDNISSLPTKVINELLKQYTLAEIINKQEYRHQIYAIIKNSKFNSSEKLIHKFFYLDSLLIANELNRSLYKKYKEKYPKLIRNYLSYDFELNNDKITIFMHENKNELIGYWSNKLGNERVYYFENKAILQIKFCEITNSIDLKSINCADIYGLTVSFKFNLDDWLLDCYTNKETEEILISFLYSDNEHKISYNNLNFSLLYLNKFRGLKNQEISFDQRFNYDFENKNITLVDTKQLKIPYFYGKNIRSVTCVVGKNGKGKTSVINFLRETFLILLHLINEQEIPCNNGYVKISDYRKYDILDNRAEFLVVFFLGKKAYFLTNIIDLKLDADDILPFDSGSYNSQNELSKIAYFSNMLSNNQDLFDEEYSINEREKSHKKRIAQSLSSFKQIDYSETSDFIQRQKESRIVDHKENTSVNRDLCYQLAFMRYLDSEKLNEYFDLQSDWSFSIGSKLSGQEITNLTIEDVGRFLKNENKNAMDNSDGNKENLETLLRMFDAKIRYFSSGQYAKFSFLAKLYWFLEGFETNADYFEKILGINTFSHDEMLIEGETALIFIDEGETYYHPEWQRKFMKTMLEMIRVC